MLGWSVYCTPFSLFVHLAQQILGNAHHLLFLSTLLRANGFAIHCPGGFFDNRGTIGQLGDGKEYTVFGFDYMRREESMKCPNCGAEYQGNKCEYCESVFGPAVSEETPTVVINHHHYYTSNTEYVSDCDPNVSPKSRGVAVLLAFFLGLLRGSSFLFGTICVGRVVPAHFRPVFLWLVRRSGFGSIRQA